MGKVTNGGIRFSSAVTIKGSLLAALLVSALPLSVHALPITVQGAFNIQEQRSVNSIGIGVGSRIRFGALSVTPNGNDGTIGIASHPGSSDRVLQFTPSPAAPDLFNTATSNTSLTSPWTLTFTNGPDTTSVLTPVAADTPPPFVRNVTVSGSGTTPTISWAVPNGFVSDGTRINVFDKTASAAAGFGVSVLTVAIDNTQTSFTIPDGVLDPGNPSGYAFEVSMLDLRDPNGSLGNFNTEGRSRTFLDFNVLGPGAPDSVYLPMVDSEGTFLFDFDVSAGETFYIDPLVAIGYDYAIGAGDPLFSSVILPDVGDSLFELYLMNDTSGEFEFIDMLLANDEYSFGMDGVSQFRILGIEPSLLLDPGDATAFVTGLTFDGDGSFTGTMTPITQDFDPASVPEPGALALLVLGLLGLGGTVRLRTRS